MSEPEKCANCRIDPRRPDGLLCGGCLFWAIAGNALRALAKAALVGLGIACAIKYLAS